MIYFEEINKDLIFVNHNNHYHNDARYFKIENQGNPLCIYGVISHDKNTCEAFWILNSFNKKVLNKTFFSSLFNHCFSLGYKEIYTWTRCKKLINVFGHFNNFGIDKIDCPLWDNDETKTWFMKRL